MSVVELNFTIPLSPVAKGRPRVALRAGRPRAYTPAKTRQSEATLRLFMESRLEHGWEPLTGPVSLMVTCHLQMPKSIPKKRQDTAKPITRPDWDNFGKLVSDAATGLLWVDDSQVVLARIAKVYAMPGSSPRWDIGVRGER